MKIENLLFGVIGLLAGAIIGFVFANSLNRSAVELSAQSANTALASSSNPALPPDHPPLGTGSGDSQAGSAIPQVMAAIEKARGEPQNYEAQMTAGDLYYQIQRFEDAAKLYEAANKLKPAETEPLVKAGNSYFDAEKYEEAEKLYLRALEKTPRDLGIRTDLGLTFYLRTPRDIDRAIKEYKAALAIDPRHEITLQNLALAYRESGDDANYQKTIELLRSVNPNNPMLTAAPDRS
jgi:tetratricopeptide (TPR) repeat protein